MQDHHNYPNIDIGFAAFQGFAMQLPAGSTLDSPRKPSQI